ncbi:hypothetical protein NEPAR05_1906 [Nematocida parisii]|nr:hypothetical protein NEPAR07_2130 [Nematocida parisii]KAI5158143.1 hypothetical protein NEPAR05_1906 [Nematocida parisii]
MNSTKTESTKEIERLILDKFIPDGINYIPKDPGRQQYRKCGIKEEKLILALEEVLFDILSPEINQLDVNEYAINSGYKHFLTYREIRKAGWILIPNTLPILPITEIFITEKRSSCYNPRYFYKVYQPDKHFNRKNSKLYGYLLIVTPLDIFTQEVFSYTENLPLLIAVSDGDTFTVIKSNNFGSIPTLLSEYTPSERT